LSVLGLVGVDLSRMLSPEETEGYKAAPYVFDDDVGFAGACAGRHRRPARQP
jgi:hypothetical protein